MAVPRASDTWTVSSNTRGAGNPQRRSPRLPKLPGAVGGHVGSDIGWFLIQAGQTDPRDRANRRAVDQSWHYRRRILRKPGENGEGVPMSAEEQIRHLMGRYIQAHDTHDVENVMALFTDDGLFANQNGEFPGHARIKEVFVGSRSRATPDRMGKMMCANSIISVDGETASALTDVVGFGRNGDAPRSIRLVAQYDDRFIHLNGEWRYTEKHVLG